MHNNAPKVLITANTSWNLENYRLPIIRSLKGSGCVLVALAPPDETTGRLREEFHELRNLTMDRKGLSPIKDTIFFARLLFAFWSEEPDVVLSYTIKNNVYGALAARSLGIPFIANVSGLGAAFSVERKWLTRIVKFLYKIAFSRVHRIFFQNPDDMRLFLDNGMAMPDQSVLLPGSGVDLSKFTVQQPLSKEGEVTFLLIARMLWDKGIAEFVETARRISDLHPRTRFQMLGYWDQNDRSAIDPGTMRAWLSEGVVEYLGATNDVRPFIAEADCIVLPTSYGEGAPRVLLEAGAMGRPVIATNVPGAREIVDHGRTGYLVPIHDPDALATASECLLELSPKQRTRMGEAARRKMESQYDVKIIEECYREAVQNAVCQAPRCKRRKPD